MVDLFAAALRRRLKPAQKKSPAAGAPRGPSNDGERLRDRNLHQGRALVYRISTLTRDLGHRYGEPGALERPSRWDADWVRHRLVEGFTIERRMPDRRIGPAIVKGAWLAIPTTDSFSDKVAQGEAPRQEIWEAWARAGGCTAAQVSRMEEALAWPGAILANGGGRAVEARCLLAWAFTVAYGRSLRQLMRTRGWSRSSFYRSVEDGAARIASHLNRHDAKVR